MNVGVVCLAFACGGAYEFGCARWVAHAEAKRPWPAVRWSIFNALVTVVGIESFLKGIPYVVAYVLGYATGTYVAVRFAGRSKPSGTESYRATEAAENARWQGRATPEKGGRPCACKKPPPPPRKGPHMTPKQILEFATSGTSPDQQRVRRAVNEALGALPDGASIERQHEAVSEAWRRVM